VVAGDGKRSAGTARQEEGSSGSNECRCRQKAAAEGSCEKYEEEEFAERSKGGGSCNGRHGDGGVAERGRGGGSGNRRDGDEEFAELSRRRGRSARQRGQ